MRKSRRKYYDVFSRFYDRFIEMHSSGHQGELKRFFAKATGVPEGGIILDICTGTGTLLPYLKARVAGAGRVVGVDFSSGMLDVARKKCTALDRTDLVQGDVGRLPFSNRVFDAVTCTHAFYELKGESQDRCLREIRRVLKPGCPFLMMEHDVPENPVVRFLFYIRIMSMGTHRAVQILKREKEYLAGYFSHVVKVNTPAGRSKILICR